MNLHPYEYASTTGETPSGDGWEKNEQIGKITIWRRPVRRVK